MGAKLGQHFLYDPGTLGRIADAASIGADDTIVEVGPGPGSLTRILARRARRVIAIELDPVLHARLEGNLRSEGIDNVELHLGDAMRFNYSSIGRFKVVANIPYQITTPLIFLLLEERARLSSMTLTIQREVAVRIASAPARKDYGVLSLAVQYYGVPEVLFTVPAAAFHPPPKVDSACLHVAIRRTPPVEVRDEELMFRVIRAGFGMRRKTLHNALKAISPDMDEVLDRAGVDPRLRAEVLDMAAFARISNELGK